MYVSEPSDLRSCVLCAQQDLFSLFLGPLTVTVMMAGKSLGL